MIRLGPEHIRRILAVTDALHIHRESVAVPLAPHGSGGVRLAADQRLEIVAPADADFDAWLQDLPARILALDLSCVRRTE